MANIYKNPVVYYIIVPVLVAIWPALVMALYLPRAEKNLENNINDYTELNSTMLEILSLAPERIETQDPNKAKEEFSYYRVVDQVASLCNIPPAKCKLNAGTANSKTQSATVTLSDIDITSFSKFLSMMQANWPKLVCSSVKLNKAENIPDEWEIIIRFEYYYTNTD
jgi:hypothetical protein